ncbi:MULTISPECIES: IclR family transcriptional regulator [unclassified Sulfitobacter]|uniref:IclR family transcriptional regulator n=1 Tax=unclassified Sulfitobacter TaxID=196795 RepID=UPI0009E05D12|nr:MULTISPECIES: IclR family transcriptional regulator [unclassified Sulfitobacter]PTA97702.1 IclR family transcriptional regulator [Sulfitobacter sp. CB-A]ULO22212.1 IclR family transcriptional regulator [Sulfitobacter sp. CB2047]
MSDENGHGQGLKSLDTALSVLAHLTRQAGPQTLTDIGRACGMPPSKVHRYLASFVAAGLVAQKGKSGRYDLGPAAMQLGLAALSRHDFINSAADELTELSAETGMTVLLSVWANQGATVVRWERGATPTDTSMGLGTTLPLLNSATGRVFLAWGARHAIDPVRDEQLRRLRRLPPFVLDLEPTKVGVEALIAATRERGYATVEGRYIPGLVAAAAPVLDWQGEVQAAVTLVGTDPTLISSGAKEINSLVAYCKRKSVVRLTANAQSAKATA